MIRRTRWMAVVAIVAGGLALPVAAHAGRIAVFNFDGPLAEKPPAEMGFSFGMEPDSLKDVVKRLEQADQDDSISAILITLGSPSMGLAQVQELSEEIGSLDKPVYAHVDSLNTGLYALLSTVDHLSVTPTGDVFVLGFYTEGLYLRGLLDKAHIVPDVVHIGDYKSAGEMFARTEPSEAAEANMNWLLDGLFSGLIKHIADARYGGNTDKVKTLIDEGPYTAEQALELGMIDSVKHREDLVADLKARFGSDVKFVHNYGGESGPELDFDNPFALFKVIGDIMSGKPESKKTAIAVIYVEGTIMTGDDNPSLFGGSSGAHSTPIRKALDEAADDDSVKAVLLRVDSPGGSALASEIIYNATQRVRKAGKPVIVSMGNVAASGGYYVSCGADRIYADPMTITASIGVVGGKLVTTGMWDMLGVNWYPYQRGESAALFTTSRKWNEAERQKITGWMNDVYGVFKGHIVEHRSTKLAKPIDEMAGGRVFTGAQALDLGLVDQMGTFDDAVEKAAELASVSDYELRVLPKPKSFLDLLREGMGGQETDRVSAMAKGDMFSAGSPLMNVVLPMLRELDPQRAKVLLQGLSRLQLMHDGQLMLMTPSDFTIEFK
ncbi:MAG TPA: signal peptide peptidase SppA [Phycisphaerae bacterium]|nr:signal peptide peptidase SppA [Phycisphaerae bacterium]